MLIFWTTLVLSLIGTNAEGELCVLHSPNSLAFIRTSETSESLLKEIYCAALGLSVEQSAEWKGIYIMDPFNTPEAVVQVYIDGVSSLGEHAGLKSKVFPLSVNEYEPDTFKGVKLRIEQRFDSGDNKIVNMKLNENQLDVITSAFGNVNLTSQKSNSAAKFIHLKHTVQQDRHFISELATLRAIIGNVQAGALIPDNLIDFYNFRFRTLHALIDFYGPFTLQTKEAKKLLGDALQDLDKAFVKAYDGSVLVTVVTTEVAHSRRSARSLTRRQTVTSAPLQSADNAAIFNILLWLGVVLAFSMLAIIYACMDMDPGRDTIIYRMTTMRTKKDL